MSGRSIKRKRMGLGGPGGDEEDDYSGGIMSEINKFMQNSGSTAKKHTLDSDEEEDLEEINKKKHKVLDDEEIEGQEDEAPELEHEAAATGIKITPFNMKDELEEGYFDGSGMYIWNKKDGSEVKDSWLDSVDWVQIQKGKDSNSKEPEDQEGSDSDEPKADDTIRLYKQVLVHLRPGETILKGIKRLGVGTNSKANLSASERLKLKKQAQKNAKAKKLENPVDMDAEDVGKGPSGPTSTSKAVTEAETPVSQLTGLANTILSSTGHMDVYQETYESIQFKIQEHEKSTKPAEVADDDGRDMFSDEFT